MKRGTPDHPKVRQLMAHLRIGKAEAVGTLELLFHFTAQFAPRGDIGRFDDLAIAEAVGWVGEPADLIAALAQAKWVDRHGKCRLVVHDWAEHCDNGVRARLRKHEVSFIGSGSKVKTSAVPEGAHSAPSAGNGSGYGSGSKAEAEGEAPDPERPAFSEFWALYPRRESKQEAEKAWHKLAPDRVLFEKIRAALEWQRKLTYWVEGKAPHPATYLNQRRWTDEKPAAKVGSKGDVGPWQQTRAVPSVAATRELIARIGKPIP